ncbi:hypothetical protein [Dactylosporangium sp. NPDC050588]|uniref:hypothetical protein n=1 Tax=Dactylosporangium sp. NPDC050588 TaxID=3157211 RepID=UPI0033C8877F
MNAALLGAALLVLLVTFTAARVRRLFAPVPPTVHLDGTAARCVDEAAAEGRLTVVPQRPGTAPATCPPGAGTALRLEVVAPDTARRAAALAVTGDRRDGLPVLRVAAWDVPDAIAAVLLHLRDRTGLRPVVHFDWPQRRPSVHWLQFLCFGTGQVALLTRHLLREVEPDPRLRPAVHVG